MDELIQILANYGLAGVVILLLYKILSNEIGSLKEEIKMLRDEIKMFRSVIEKLIQSLIKSGQQ